MEKKSSKQNFHDDMSVEQRKQVWDVVKIIVGISLAISSFVIADTYNSSRHQLERLNDKLDSMEGRMIRIEYELKLK